MNNYKEMKLGELADMLQDLKTTKANMNKKLKELNANQSEVEAALIERMEAEGIERAAGNLCSVTKKVETRSRVTDKEAFAAWLFKTGRYEFMQASVNQAPVREMLENENDLPAGIDTFLQTKINTRKK